MRRTLTRWLIALTLTPAAAAHAEAPQTLHPFRATYSATLDAGVAISADAVRELRQLEDGSWVFDSTANALVASQQEQSRFTYRDGMIRPLGYHYLREVLGKERRADITFDWQQGRVTTTVKGKPWQMSITPGTQDKLSYQLQLRRDLARGKTEMRYQVADGGPLSEYRFRVLGEETVSTPQGDYRTVKVERVREQDAGRTTHIWFAPALEYLIVKLYQTEPDGKEYGLLLNQLESR